MTRWYVAWLINLGVFGTMMREIVLYLGTKWKAKMCIWFRGRRRMLGDRCRKKSKKLVLPWTCKLIQWRKLWKKNYMKNIFFVIDIELLELETKWDIRSEPVVQRLKWMTYTVIFDNRNGYNPPMQTQIGIMSKNPSTSHKFAQNNAKYVLGGV